MKLKVCLIMFIVMLSGCDSTVDKIMLDSAEDVCKTHDGVAWINIAFNDTVRCNDGVYAELIKRTIIEYK